MTGVPFLCVANSARSQVAEAARLAAFRMVRDELHNRIERLAQRGQMAGSHLRTIKTC
jgi:hypothetical protein